MREMRVTFFVSEGACCGAFMTSFLLCGSGPRFYTRVMGAQPSCGRRHEEKKMRFLPAVAVVVSCLAAPVVAQTYPVKTVRLIAPFAPGGATDVLARLAAQKLSERWGHTIIVDNRVGAGGHIGAE